MRDLRLIGEEDPFAERDLAVAPQFLSAPFDDVLEEATDRSDPSDRIDHLRLVYEAALEPRWRRFTESMEAHLTGLDRFGAETDGQTRQPFEVQIAEMDARFQGDRERHEAQNRELLVELNSSIEEANTFVGAIWNRLGPGLGVATPTLASAATVPNGSAGPRDYGRVRARAAALPSFGPLAAAPELTLHVWWISLLALVAGWLGGGWWGWGVLLAGAAVAALVAVTLWRRRDAVQAFGQLVRATELENHRRFEDAAVAVSRSDAVVRNLEQQWRSARQALEQQREAAELETASQLAELYASAATAWNESVETCATLLRTLDRLIGEARSGLPDPSKGVVDSLWFRLGEVHLRPLADLSATVRALLPDGLLDEPRSDVEYLPVFWNLQARRSMLLEGERPIGEAGLSVILSLCARLISQISPGRARFTFVDPVALGGNFAGLLKLGGYSRALDRRSWSDPDKIRERLRDLIEHIETVTQQYLRNDYPDIEAYNAQPGQIAEPYRFLVIADFPSGFREDTARDLLRVLQNGPRCGVFVVIHADRSAPAERGVDLAVFKPHLIQLQIPAAFENIATSSDFGTQSIGVSERSVILDPPLPADQLNAAVARYGEGASAAEQAEVTYASLMDMAGLEGDAWGTRPTAAEVIRVPIGPTAGREIQYLTFGGEGGHHGLVVGLTAFGKSNLLHVFIVGAARLYPPDELQFYLIDFKSGVEFTVYADAGLPHARVIAVRSEREFGLAILQDLCDQVADRGRRFAAAGALDLAAYNRSRPAEALPRLVLVFDEFQRLFEGDDATSARAGQLLEQLARQGRGFGVNLLLGTQSLGTAGLNRATMDQMLVRIALKSSESDSRLLFADSTLAATGLSRKGEAIYNEAGGAPDRSTRFQTARITPETLRRELGVVAEAARARAWNGPPPRVFADLTPADLSDLARYQAAIRPGPLAGDLPLWIGESASLAPLVQPTLRREAGANLLVLSQDEGEGMGVLMAAMVSAALHTAVGECSFHVIDLSTPQMPWSGVAQAFSTLLPHACMVSSDPLVPDLSEIANEVRRRVAASPAKQRKGPRLILSLVGLHRANGLRGASGRTAAAEQRDLLTEILRDGPEVGVHAMAWCNTYATLDRTFDERPIDLFGIRIAGRLSASDSDRLFDDQVAARIDRDHRMVVYDTQVPGSFRHFRPYSAPSAALLADLGEAVRRTRSDP